jgi:hypothetical protein
MHDHDSNTRPCVVCACSHLSEFAVVSSENRIYNDGDDDDLSSVEIVIIVLSSVSVFLAFVIVVFAVFVIWNIAANRDTKKRRKKQRGKRMAHLKEMTGSDSLPVPGTHESYEGRCDAEQHNCASAVPTSLSALGDASGDTSDSHAPGGDLAQHHDALDIIDTPQLQAESESDDGMPLEIDDDDEITVVDHATDVSSSSPSASPSIAATTTTTTATVVDSSNNSNKEETSS